ncbi:MAG TPA: hypothetical protein RMH85_11295 [Polyangiaceae bacterium LLY-WYZ-15_(1-7)]|nr:septum formation inhibitor Maf [Sandaracinus sp.]HJL05915.1 hypothetical protein [Polyangiaceae bacterium LLY-WYZ-15_(1-7)]HJL09080.1 hypothetical protein [Polyangiaceae bacterium LLY-WYZ-15_(1-7)]HJL21085.1 hypothetical protein [Polyangiaceae bacterium LLY-WYZ-15_(1-7)]HJL36475.1 hypothetical protein [Polyangiaceae bacterium LLY-WYZ-15_(1-7)]
MRPLVALVVLVASSLVAACGSDASDPASAQTTPEAPGPTEEVAEEGPALDLPTPAEHARAHGEFGSYWHQGLAELTRYELRQARYGDVHEGEAVLIFVTEPFLPDAQVKHEHGDHESVPVLKLNAWRRFFTGIYPYTILTSSFQPEEGPRALKVASSVTEWCGVAYAQLNRREDAVEAVVHSYFQDEGDQALRLEEAGVAFEDALWQRLRRDPGAIETGERRMVPAMHSLRMTHRPLQAYDAEVRVEEGEEEGTEVLAVTYPALGRMLRVTFREAFPHVIEGWTEREGPDAPVTRATRSHAVLTDYWAHNGAEDGAYRHALGFGDR